jgi:hypothetical protein
MHLASPTCSLSALDSVLSSPPSGWTASVEDRGGRYSSARQSRLPRKPPSCGGPLSRMGLQPALRVRQTSGRPRTLVDRPQRSAFLLEASASAGIDHAIAMDESRQLTVGTRLLRPGESMDDLRQDRPPEFRLLATGKTRRSHTPFQCDNQSRRVRSSTLRASARRRAPRPLQDGHE